MKERSESNKEPRLGNGRTDNFTNFNRISRFSITPPPQFYQFARSDSSSVGSTNQRIPHGAANRFRLFSDHRGGFALGGFVPLLFCVFELDLPIELGERKNLVSRTEPNVFLKIADIRRSISLSKYSHNTNAD